MGLRIPGALVEGSTDAYNPTKPARRCGVVLRLYCRCDA